MIAPPLADTKEALSDEAVMGIEYARSVELLGQAAAPVLRARTALSVLLPRLRVPGPGVRFSPPHTCGIATARIVALPWHPGRLSDARTRLAKGDTPPPVNVTRYRIGKDAWYLLTDGMHRSWAAYEAGRSRIGATIDGEIRCAPDQYVLRRWGNTWSLWHRPTGQDIGDLLPGWVAPAVALGVMVGAPM